MRNTGLRHYRRPFRKFRHYIAILVFLVLCAGNLYGRVKNLEQEDKQFQETARNEQDYPSQDKSKTSSASDADDMQVQFIDVGQGDSTLIECDGEYMLIDAGPNDQGLELWDYLQKQGATHLKYAVGTHPDADHIGGLDVILYRCDVDTVMMPDVSNDTRTYDDVVQTIFNKNLKRISPSVGSTYTLGTATFTIVAPNKDYGTDDTNDWSIGILLQNGNDRFLFVGDAEKEAEHDMVMNGIDLHADVYKVAHHGSSTGTTQEFLDSVNPSYAVISCGKGNKYGHPHEQVLRRLKEAGVKVFRTDEQGTVIAYSSGNGITWNASPSETWQPGDAK